MKLIVAGSREFGNYQLLTKHLDEINSKYGITEIVSGTAKGADSLGELYAKIHNIPIKRFPADWNKYGRSAGYIRNKDMAHYADACICFWVNKSKGTGHMINLAKEYKIRLRVVEL
jgi:hypothetical protein